jgi:hypothetical protein
MELFRPAAAPTGVEIPAVSRHIPIFSRCLGLRDAPVLVARCRRVGSRPRRRPGQVLMLTRHRLVITAESRLLRRMRLHLNCDLRDLADVTWTPEPEQGGIRLAATAMDGVRENLWVDAGDADRVRRVDDVLKAAFVHSSNV